MTDRDYPVEADRGTKQQLVDAGELHPVGTPFYPSETSIPDSQTAWGITADPETGSPDHGEPFNDGAEKEIVIPVEEPGPNDALLYMLTSEVNYNDCWAITGIPVSTFEGHSRDWHITGSGGLGLVVDIGEGIREEDRIDIGDLVSVYAGQFDVLSPKAGRDPMFADFRIQGYQTPDGSHQQFMVAQATQLYEPPSILELSEAGGYTLTLGTVYRALTTTLDVKPNGNIFIEGASTGTGRDAVGMAVSRGLYITGMVSSEERAKRAKQVGADAVINRKQEEITDAMRMVPRDPAEWDDWEAAGEPLLERFRSKNDGRLADYAVSHAGQAAFSRTYQLLAENGRLTFYGASTGYELAYLGKEGESTPSQVFERAHLSAGDGVLVWYGTPNSVSGATDDVGETAIEAALGTNARVVAVTDTDDQADYVEREYAVKGTISLETLATENDEFEFVEALPELPPPSEPDALASTVGTYSSKMFKPIGIEIGKLLGTSLNPRGNPDVVFERAGQNTLGVSTMLCAPFQGKVVYSENMAGQRYSFYAPQVWMRQRRIYMPTTDILGTHMKNTYEVMKMNAEIEQELFDVPKIHITPWEETPQAHQDMWDNVHKEGSYVINHALPRQGLDSKAELFEAWEKM